MYSNLLSGTLCLQHLPQQLQTHLSPLAIWSRYGTWEDLPSSLLCCQNGTLSSSIISDKMETFLFFLFTFSIPGIFPRPLETHTRCFLLPGYILTLASQLSLSRDRTQEIKVAFLIRKPALQSASKSFYLKYTFFLIGIHISHML